MLARASCAGCTLARHAVVPGRATAADASRRTGRFRNHLTPCFRVNSSDHVASLAVWSNIGVGIASNTPSGAASCCPFIASGRERADAIAGAVVRSPTCCCIYHSIASYVTNRPALHGGRHQCLPRKPSPHSTHLHYCIQSTLRRTAPSIP